MSDLQLSLAVIGAIVVCAVYCVNVLQERKLRRRLEKAFDGPRGDVLLEPEAAAEVRIEPQLTTPKIVEDAQPVDPIEPVPEVLPEIPPGPEFDSDLDCVAEIQAAAPIPESALSEFLARAAQCGKPIRAAGYPSAQGGWEEAGSVMGGHYTALRIALQLADHTGAIDAAHLTAFCDAVKKCAARAGGRSQCPDMQAALEAARAIDGFCADVDVAIGINIIAPAGQPFAGTQIRALAEGAGFRLEPDGVFRFRDDHRQVLFSLDNHEPAPFLPEQIQRLSTTGVTLLLDVPRVAAGQRAIDRMLEIAPQLAETLGGALVDDNRKPLNAAGIAAIKHQLKSIHDKMEAHGVAAGSERARRLFA